MCTLSPSSSLSVTTCVGGKGARLVFQVELFEFHASTLRSLAADVAVTRHLNRAAFDVPFAAGVASEKERRRTNCADPEPRVRSRPNQLTSRALVNFR